MMLQNAKERKKLYHFKAGAERVTYGFQYQKDKKQLGKKKKILFISHKSLHRKQIIVSSSSCNNVPGAYKNVRNGLIGG